MSESSSFDVNMMTNLQSLHDWANSSEIERAFQGSEIRMIDAEQEREASQPGSQSGGSGDDLEIFEDAMGSERSLVSRIVSLRSIMSESSFDDNMMTKLESLHDWANSSEIERAFQGSEIRMMEAEQEHEASQPGSQPGGPVDDLEIFEDATSALRQPSRTPGRTVRFAGIIATDIETPPSSPDHRDIIDMMESESSFVDEQPNSTKRWNSFDIFEQERATTFGNNSAFLTTQQSLEASLDINHDLEDESRMSEEPENEQQKVRRQMLYAVGGAGAFALSGWAARKVLQIFSNEDQDDHNVGGDAWGNTAGGNHATTTSDTSQALLVSKDGGSTLLEQSGNLSNSLSQSQSYAGGGFYMGGGEHAAANPALQR
jgi:hypothetical protein